MNDEIKVRTIEQQAIDNLKAIINCKDKIIEIEPPLEDTAKILLDYITNLQEENEKVHKELDYADNYNIYLISRIDKAIEYIKQNSKCGGSFINDKFVIEYIDEIYNGMELLKILIGGDE